MEKYILSIDAGTTSSRALIIDKKGIVKGLSQKEFPQIFPKKGWVEHDPNQIWETQLRVIKDVLEKTKISPKMIHSIGVTNQRETTVLWNKKTGVPVYNAIVWQDRRTAEICNDLKSKNLEKTFQDKTGLLLDPYFSGTKIKWILDSNPEIKKLAANNNLAFGTIDTWLIWKLTKGEVHVTDVTNASRTLLFNIHNLNWDKELIDYLEIPENILPKVVSCSENVGLTSKDILGFSIPISGIAGDQQASLFGQMCIEPGDVKNTYGTGCFCMMNTGEKVVKSKHKMLSTIAYQLDDKTFYAIEGSVFTGGALVQWLRDELGIISNASEIESLALTVENSGGITFISGLSGLGAPHWNPDASGSILGINRGTKKGHIARAALEAIAIRTYEIIICMEKDANTKFTSLKVDGGGSNNDLLMQIQSDLLKTKVVRSSFSESTALGVAFLAGLASGYWDSVDDLKNIWKKDKEFIPDNSKNDNILSKWKERMDILY